MKLKVLLSTDAEGKWYQWSRKLQITNIQVPNIEDERGDNNGEGISSPLCFKKTFNFFNKPHM